MLTMKAVITILFIILIGAAALAQNRVSHESKVQHNEVGVLLDLCTVCAIDCEEPSQVSDIARLYKRSNTRVRKALSFNIKYQKAKLA